MRNYLIVLLLLILFNDCARQTSPDGGPQDKTPPELLSSLPKNNQTNYSGEKIELTFNEYLKLKDPATEILITPAVGKETKFLVKKNKVTIIPKNKFKENTTYSIAFREAIQDLNEGNPTSNLRLAFSTGPIIDSLELNGSVYQVFNEERPEKITVALFESDTFNIYNHQPVYFSQTDKKGRFKLSNLKAGNYQAYAFDDKSKNLKVESKTERFGFITKKINLTSKTDSIHIPLFRVDARPIKITSIRHTQKISKVRFNKSIDSVKIKSNYSNYFIRTYGDKQDEIAFYGILKEQPIEDSLRLQLQVRDSVGNRIDTTIYLKSLKIKVPKETFTTKFLSPTYNIENQTLTLKGTFNKPLSQVNTDSIYIQIDSTQFQSVNKENIFIDTLHHEFTLKTILKLTTPTPAPLIVLGKGALVSIEQDSSKAKTEIIKVPKEDAVGSLSIDIQTKEKNYFLQLLSSSGAVISTHTNIRKYTFKNLDPQEYKIRIIVDPNKNGAWDPGNIEKRIDPEKVIVFKNFDGKTLIPIRANWEVGPLVIKF